MARKGQGWHGDPKGHAAAAKGEKVKQMPASKGHKTAKGDVVNSDNYIDKLADDTI